VCGDLIVEGGGTAWKAKITGLQASGDVAYRANDDELTIDGGSVGGTIGLQEGTETGCTLTLQGDVALGGTLTADGIDVTLASNLRLRGGTLDGDGADALTVEAGAKVLRKDGVKPVVQDVDASATGELLVRGGTDGGGNSNVRFAGQPSIAELVA
jgi:hypothetical protein